MSDGPPGSVEEEQKLVFDGQPSNPKPSKSHTNTVRRTRTSSLKSPTVEDAERFRHRTTASLAAVRGQAASISQEPTLPTTEMVDGQVDPTRWERIRRFYEKNKGLAYVLLAQFFGTLMNVTTRLLEVEGNHGAGMHPLQILFVRMIITTTLSTLYMWWAKIPHFPFGVPEVRWLLVLRGIGGFFGVFGMYYSLLYLPLADATVVTFIAPSLSCFACAILLKEPYTRMEQIGALVSFIGVVLIARPTSFFHRGEGPAPIRGRPGRGGDDSIPAHAPQQGSHAVLDLKHITSAQRVSAVLVALVGVVGSAMAFTTMRWIGKRAHPLLSVNYYCACVTIVSAVAMAVIPSVGFLMPAGVKEWGYLIFLGLCGFAMQCLLSAGLQHEKSSRATNMVYTQMLFAMIFDKLVFGNNPALLSLLGSTLILSSAIYVAMQKETMKQRQEAEKARQEAANSSGREMEMQRRRLSASLRDEERGLMQNADLEEDDEKEIEEQHQNGHVKGAS